MWCYFIILLLVVFCIYKERQALGCKDIPDGSDCKNNLGKAVIGTKSNFSDSDKKIFENIIFASEYANRDVVWRRAFLISCVSAIVIIWILYQRLPSEIEFTVIIIVITILMYSSSNFYKFHLIDHIQNNITESVNILKSRYKI